jgi:hypothetical protein
MLFKQMNQRKQASYQDLRINIKEVYEVQYWSRKWGISPLQLETAVKACGSNVARHVEAFLKDTGKI